MDKNKGNDLSNFIPKGYVVGYKFDLMSDEDIKKKAVVKITSSANTTQEKTPYPHGPRSQLLGTDSGKYKCLTCDQSKGHCRVGHDVYIETFAHFSPHKNIMAITKKVISILCVNNKCNKIIFSTDKLDYEKKYIYLKKKDLLTHMYETAKQEKSVCFSCKTPVRIAEDNKMFPMIFKYVLNNIIKYDLYPYMVYETLMRTSEDEFKKYFPNIPERKKLCNTLTLISGIPMRLDSISAITNKPEPNEITTAYNLLLKYTAECGKDFKLSSTQEITEEIKKNQDAVLYLKYSIVNGKINIGPDYAKNDTIKSIISFIDRKSTEGGIANISGKDGPVRGGILAKRIHNIGRLVATCDNTLKFGHVRLPENLMKNLYTVEVYNEFNMIRLNALYINGAKYPGAEYIIRSSDNSKLYSEEVNKTYVPQISDTIKRNVCGGDLVNVGRAPTLMPYNVSAYKISNEFNTLGDSLCIKSSEYKKLKDGGFDGDESSVIAPRDMNGLAELSLLMKTQNIVTTIKNGDVQLGIDCNSLIGASL